MAARLQGILIKFHSHLPARSQILSSKRLFIAHSFSQENHLLNTKMCDPSLEGLETKTANHPKKRPLQDKPHQPGQDFLGSIMKFEITRRLIEERADTVRIKLDDWEERVAAETDYPPRAEERFEGSRLFTEWAGLYKEMGDILQERPTEDFGLYDALSKLANRDFVRFYSHLIADPNMPYNERKLRQVLYEDFDDDHSDNRHAEAFSNGNHPERSLGTKVMKQVKPPVSVEVLRKVNKENVELEGSLSSHDVTNISDPTGHTTKGPLMGLWKRVVKYWTRA